MNSQSSYEAMLCAIAAAFGGKGGGGPTKGPVQQINSAAELEAVMASAFG
jgi:hypothetical protein